MTPSCRHLHVCLDGTATAEARAEFEAHLSTCEACTAAVKQWNRFSDAFEAATRPHLMPPTPGDVARLMAKVEKPAPSLRYALWVSAAAAVVLALTVALFLRPAGSSVPALVDGAPLLTERIEASPKPQTLEVAGATVNISEQSELDLLRHDNREVRMQLRSGKVKLKVAPRKPGQKFSVQSGKWNTVVVGTQFSVLHDGDTVKVHVDEGHVRVESGAQVFNVVTGETFRAVGEQGSVVSEPQGADEAGGFGPDAPDAGETEAVDGGEALDAGIVERPDPKIRAPSVSSAEALRWRRAASEGNCPSVIREIETVLQRIPRSVTAWSALADCHRLTGHYAEAVKAYTQVLKFGSGSEADRARLFLADLHQQKGRHLAAVQVLKAYLAHAQPAELEAAARLRLAKSLLALGKKADAQKELRTITGKLPQTPSSLEALELLKAQ